MGLTLLLGPVTGSGARGAGPFSAGRRGSSFRLLIRFLVSPCRPPGCFYASGERQSREMHHTPHALGKIDDGREAQGCLGGRGRDILKREGGAGLPAETSLGETPEGGKEVGNADTWVMGLQAAHLRHKGPAMRGWPEGLRDKGWDSGATAEKAGGKGMTRLWELPGAAAWGLEATGRFGLFCKSTGDCIYFLWLL